MSDNDWYNEWQRITSDNEWSLRLIFLYCELREEPTTKHPQQNSLNFQEDIQEGLLS